MVKENNNIIMVLYKIPLKSIHNTTQVPTSLTNYLSNIAT